MYLLISIVLGVTSKNLYCGQCYRLYVLVNVKTYNRFRKSLYYQVLIISSVFIFSLV